MGRLVSFWNHTSLSASVYHRVIYYFRCWLIPTWRDYGAPTRSNGATGDEMKCLICKKHNIKIDRHGNGSCICGSTFSQAYLSALAGSAAHRPGSTTRPESRICPKCGKKYGRADLCCHGCGHCFILNGYHAANLPLDTLQESVVK